MRTVQHITSARDVETLRFRDRREAGRRLADLLMRHKGKDVIVLGLPRGGVPVAYEVAEALDAPLDVFIVRKLGVPGHEELAMGAIAGGGIRDLNEDVIRQLGIPDPVIESVAERELEELRRREQKFRGNRPAPRIAGRTVIVVDDGLATGSSMRAAVSAIQSENPAEIVVAVPTSAAPTAEDFEPLVDEVVCIILPEPFYGVGMWYDDFEQTSDDEVRERLEDNRRKHQGICE